MNSRSTEQQYRLFFLVFAGLAFFTTLAELWFIEHMESTLQLLPFFLCGLGLITIFLTALVPSKKVVQGHRIIMGIVAAGGLFGIYEHVEHNLAFELEIRPNAEVSDTFQDALSGASPFLAPGILTFAAFMALAATYRHPSLEGYSGRR